jgi:hypothetical protein
VIREWLKRRYIEADYRYLEAKHIWWWHPGYMARARRRRDFWRWLSKD